MHNNIPERYLQSNSINDRHADKINKVLISVPNMLKKNRGSSFWLTVACETLVACVMFAAAAAASSTVTVALPELPLIKYAPPPPLTTASYQTTQHTDASLNPRTDRRILPFLEYEFLQLCKHCTGVGNTSVSYLTFTELYNRILIYIYIQYIKRNMQPQSKQFIIYILYFLATKNKT